MPYASREKRLEYGREYRKQHPRKKRTEEQKAHSKEYRKRHYLNDVEWLKKNKEQSKEIVSEKNMKYDNQRLKLKTINGWLNHDIKSANWDYVYDRFINTFNCEVCNIEFIIGSRGNDRRCLDHHHLSGEIRNVLCNKCNCQRIKIDRLHTYVLLDLHRYFIFKK